MATRKQKLITATIFFMFFFGIFLIVGGGANLAIEGGLDPSTYNALNLLLQFAGVLFTVLSIGLGYRFVPREVWKSYKVRAKVKKVKKMKK